MHAALQQKLVLRRPGAVPRNFHTIFQSSD
jgi:hypothetical protein